MQGQHSPRWRPLDCRVVALLAMTQARPYNRPPLMGALDGLLVVALEQAVAAPYCS